MAGRVDTKVKELCPAHKEHEAGAEPEKWTDNNDTVWGLQEERCVQDNVRITLLL